jgi:hypothetical protein
MVQFDSTTIERSNEQIYERPNAINTNETNERTSERPIYIYFVYTVTNERMNERTNERTKD